MEKSPNDLKQAIRNGLCAAHSPHNKEMIDRLFDHVRDFLAQRFTAAIFHADSGQEEQLVRLFAKIIEKDEGS